MCTKKTFYKRPVKCMNGETYEFKKYSNAIANLVINKQIKSIIVPIDIKYFSLVSNNNFISSGVIIGDYFHTCNINSTMILDTSNILLYTDKIINDINIIFITRDNYHGLCKECIRRINKELYIKKNYDRHMNTNETII